MNKKLTTVGILALLGLSVFIVPQAHAALTTNLLFFANLTDGSGTTAVDSVSANNGTLQTNASFTTGKVTTATTAHTVGGITFGQPTALDLTTYPLSQSNCFDTTFNGTQTNSNMKLSGAEKGSSPYSQFSIVMIEDGSSNNGRLQWRYRDTAGNDFIAQSTTAYNDGNPHSAIGVVDSSGNMTLYVDGSSVATASASGTLATGKYVNIGNDYIPNSSANSVWIGHQWSDGIWSRALTASEAAQLWNSGTCLTYSGLSSGASAPTVTTSAATSITITTATGNGNVTADGGATITERGIVIGASTNPTTSNTKFTTSGTTGAYAASLTGLTASTTYHERAYAINSVGTSYGADNTFTTSTSGGSSSITITPNTTTMMGSYTIDSITITYH